MTTSYRQNPKQVGSSLIDANPQTGPCPMHCSNCYYNRDSSLWKPNIPTKKDAEDKIVRMNALHDSNIEKELVLETAKRYRDVFFNTSIPNFDFPGPVVLTANREETMLRHYMTPPTIAPDNLMFVRLKIALHNLSLVCDLATDWTLIDVPVVLTFMRYENIEDVPKPFRDNYEEKVHIVHSWWSLGREFKAKVLRIVRNAAGSRLVTMCGTLDSSYCKDCRNCETYYYITRKRLEEKS